MDELAVLYGDLYTEKNVMITATHSHAAPGGMHTYWMYTKPTGGIITQTFDIYVRGIVEVIVTFWMKIKLVDDIVSYSTPGSVNTCVPTKHSNVHKTSSDRPIIPLWTLYFRYFLGIYESFFDEK